MDPPQAQAEDSSMFSPGKFAASSARREQRREKETSQQGADAYNEMRSQMSSWTSDKVGTMSLTGANSATDDATFSSEYERDPVEWLNRTVAKDNNNNMMMVDEDYDNQDEDYDERLPITTPPKRSARQERAATPVMSNSSKKKMRPSASFQPDGIIPETPDAEIAANVQSPWMSTTTTTPHAPSPMQSPLASMATTARTTNSDDNIEPIVSRASFSSRGSHHEYHRYHQALLGYLKTKRRVVERMDVVSQQQQQTTSGSTMFGADNNDNDAMDTSTDNDMAGFSSFADSTLVAEETRAELDYLKALNMLCWDRAAADHQGCNMLPAARKEGNFWALAVSLRELGLASLVWADDAASWRQNANALTAYVEGLATRVHSTPLELVCKLQTGVVGCPMVLERRQNIICWLEHCFSKILPAGVTRPRNANILPDSKQLAQEGLPETDKDEDILKCCLALILAGRVEDAKELACQSGVPWRAAMWSGGTPHGFKETANDDTKAMDREVVGNTRRPVWRRMIWKLSEKLASDRGASNDEAAIAALLSNNLKNALSNQSLRSWEKGLYATCRSIMGRVEDELLHMHNNHRRTMRPAFPGTDYENQEREHLFATSDVASMNEGGVITVMTSAPYEEMRSDDIVTEATASFLIGKNAIMAYIQDSHAHLEIQDEAGLRFLTHLALYLDSLGHCTTPIFLDGLVEWKNDVLLVYLRHLASREDLWHMLVLYASLLPDATLLESLPELLAPIESQEERIVVVRQMRELVPTAGTDLLLLRRVVRLVLSEQDAITSTATPTLLDMRKMKAVKWLCIADEHFGDALVCSNMLLRRFLLADKISSAFTFRDDIRPDALFEDFFQAGTMQNAAEGINEDADYVGRLEHAKAESSALDAYLDAFRDFEHWRQVVASTNAVTNAVDDALDKSQLNATEAAIATKMERRDLVHDKRKWSHVVISAADKAQQSLLGVLEHDGGWLVTEDEEIVQGEEEMIRRSELQELRVKLLPDCAMFYHQVCMETASWMSASLDDCVGKLGGSSESVLADLDESTDTTSSSPVSPQYWSEKALELVPILASDTNKVNSACGSAELKELMSKAAEACVTHMLYSTQREKYVSAFL